MTASRTRGGAQAAALIAALALAASASAAPDGGSGLRTAQVGPPVRLGPPTRLGPPRARPDGTPPAVEPAAPTEAPASEAPELALPPPDRSRGIEIDTLGSVDPDSVGLLDPSQGGFGVDMWRGTDKALVERLLPQLVAATPSRFVRGLTIRLLLSRATAPRGTANPGSDSRSLLTVRIERLLALAEVEPAIKLLRLAPAETMDEAHARVEVDSLFYQNDNAGACGKVRGFAREYRGAFWQQANAFCLALAGDHARSAMVADILREREAEIGPAFYTLVDALGGNDRAVVDSLPNPNALTLAMMRAANRRLPRDAIAAGRPDVLRAVAFSPNADLDLRLDAAERAFGMGAVTAAELGELYGAVEFTPDQLANPLTAAGETWGPRGRALLLRAAAGADAATARAEILRRAWNLSRERGGHDVMLGASVPVVAAIEPTPALMWFAADAAQALFGAGRVAVGRAWYALAETESAGNPQARAAAVALWPLARIAADEDAQPWRPDALAAWLKATREAQGAAQGEAARGRALMMLGALQALGEPIGPEAWTGLLDGETMTTTAAMPDAALWNALDRAAERHETGLTVLLSLLALGEHGPRAADPLTVGKVIRSLRAIGLDHEARALALEAVTGTQP